MAKKKETRLGWKEKRKRERKRERKAKRKKEGLETFLPFNDTINFVFNCFEGIFQTKWKISGWHLAKWADSSIFCLFVYRSIVGKDAGVFYSPRINVTSIPTHFFFSREQYLRKRKTKDGAGFDPLSSDKTSADLTWLLRRKRSPPIRHRFRLQIWYRYISMYIDNREKQKINERNSGGTLSLHEGKTQSHYKVITSLLSYHHHHHEICVGLELDAIGGQISLETSLRFKKIILCFCCVFFVY